MLKLLIFFKMLKLFETCLYLLASGPGPGSGTQFVFTGPGLQLVLPALALNLCLLATVYKFITSPGPEFAYTNLVSSICICVYSPGLRFVLLVQGLKLHLSYYW